MNSAETKISNAFRKASQYCVEGQSPNDALSQAVVDYDLNPNMAKRAAELLNIHLTQTFLKSAGDKTASFPLAEVPEVFKKAFLEPRDKTAGITHSVRRKVAAATPARAHARWSPQAEAAPRDLNDLVQHLNGCIKQASEEVQALKEQARTHEYRAFDVYTKLADLWSQRDMLPKFADFEYQVVSEYGPGVRDYLDIFATLLPSPSRLDKEARVKSASYFERGVQHGLFDTYMENLEAIDALQPKIAEAQGVLDGMENFRTEVFAEITGAKAKTANAADFLTDGKTAALNSSIHGAGRFFLKQLPGDPFATEADGGDTLSQSLYAKGHAHNLHKQYAGPEADAESEMQNLRRSAILRDLLTNDEIIGGYDPHHVQGAYNALLQLAPDATMNREVTRSFLRSATANQAVDPFTAKQIVDLQNEMMKQKGTLPAAPQAGK